MTNVRVRGVNRTKVRVNNPDSGVLGQVPAAGVTVRTVSIDGSGGGGVQNLDDLLDVVIGSPSDGETLLYDADTGKFVSTPLVVDGGEF